MIKSYKTILTLAVAGMMGLASCTGDLDLLPTDPQETTAGSFQDDPNAYMESVFADVAVNFVSEGATGNTLDGLINGGFGVFQRAIFVAQEVPTDEACWLYYQNDAEYGQMPFGVVSPATVVAIAPYYRLVVNASLCNDFIINCKNGYFDGADKDNMEYLMTQARTLRQICMYYLLDLYGNVPWISEDSEVGSTPNQMRAAEIYNLLVADMEENLKNYQANRNVPYGYLSIDAHEAYLVKLYLNAEVYSGKADWANAYKHAKAIIDRHQGSGFQGSGLCMNYGQLFGQNNAVYAPGGGSVNEILWTLPTRKQKLETWGASTNMLAAMLNSNGTADITALYNYKDAWNCIVSRSQLVKQFEWDDNAMSVSPDQRVRFWLTSKDGYSFGKPLSFTYAPDYGYPAVKFSNWVIKDNGDIDVAASGDPVENGTFNCDYPMVRLAEIYLSAAEAILNGGGGSRADALKYVNYIRERAGVSAWAPADLSENNLRAERQRELYTECTRRTDLRRYHQWISGYNWDYKGNPSNIDGQDFPASFDLYPLPSVVCSMAGYIQNDGY